MARLPGESVSVLLSRLMTEGLKLALLTALEGGCNLRQTRRKTLRKYSADNSILDLLLVHCSCYLMNEFCVRPLIRIRIDALGHQMTQFFRIVVRRERRIITLFNLLA